MTAPSPDSRRLEAMLEDIGRRLSVVEEGLRASQLDRSSIDGGVLEVRGSDGTTLSTWGVQPDGTSGTKSFNKVPPPVPSAADVTPTIAGLDLAWGGQLVGNMPADFQAVRFYLSPVPDFIVGESNYVGSLSRAGSIPVGPLPYVTHYVKLVAVNQAGAQSMPSLQSSGTPSKVVADAVLDGIVTETALAASAVTEAKLAAKAVTQTKVADNAISSPKIIAGAVQTEKIAADAVSAGKIAADAVTAREVRAQSLTGDEIAANSITAGHVKAGAVTAKHLEADLALATRLIAGDPRGTRVELSGSGMYVVRADGETTFSVDASTGDVVSMGQYYTQRYGERIAMNVAGLSEPAIRAYPRRGNRYADLRSYTRTVGSVDIANWEIRLPLQGQEAGLFDLMVYDASFNPIASSRLRYRPFFNTSGVVHCGWAADGQDVAIVFYGGRAFITNSSNTDRRPLNVGELYAEDKIITRAGLQVGDAPVPVNGQIQARELTLVGNALVNGNVYVPGGNVTTDPSGSMNSLHFYGGTFHGVLVASERDLKDHRGEITDGVARLRRLTPVRYSWQDPERDRERSQLPGTTHLGFYVDEVADAAPEAVVPMVDRAGAVWPQLEGEPEEHRPIANGVRTFDDRGVLAVTVAAVRELADDRDRLAAEVAQLKTVLDQQGAA